LFAAEIDAVTLRFSMVAVVVADALVSW